MRFGAHMLRTLSLKSFQHRFMLGAEAKTRLAVGCLPESRTSFSNRVSIIQQKNKSKYGKNVFV
jgi:hypothetical protein